MDAGALREDGRVVLTGSDFHHAARVMRMQPGDTVQVVVAGRAWAARMEALERDGVRLELLWQAAADPEPRLSLTWLQGLPKGDKIETVVRHACEIGAARLWVFAGARSVAELPAGRRDARLERWRRLAKETSELAQRARIPAIAYFPSLAAALDRWSAEEGKDGEAAAQAGAPGPADRMPPAPRTARSLLLAPYEAQDVNLPAIRSVLLASPPPSWAAFAIGPEGGFAKAEAAALRGAGARLCTLGPRILRTETAGIVTAAAIMYEWGELAPPAAVDEGT